MEGAARSAVCHLAPRRVLEACPGWGGGTHCDHSLSQTILKHLSLEQRKSLVRRSLAHAPENPKNVFVVILYSF